MSDEASLEGQAENVQPGAEGAESPHDWEKDYKELQATFTKSQQALKEQESVWDDEEALISRIRERYPDWVAEDDGPDTGFVEGENPPPTPPHDPRLDELLPEFQRLQEAEAERSYQSDLKSLIGDREVNDGAKKFIRAATRANGDNYQALEAAVTEWFELFPPEEKKRPAASHVPGSGKPVTAGKPFSEMTRDERLAWQIERVNQIQSQT